MVVVGALEQLGRRESPDQEDALTQHLPAHPESPNRDIKGSMMKQAPGDVGPDDNIVVFPSRINPIPPPGPPGFVWVSPSVKDAPPPPHSQQL